MKHRQGRRSVLSLGVISGIRRATAGVLAGALMVTALPAIPAFAAGDDGAQARAQGTLTGVQSIEQDATNKNQANITFTTADGTVDARITFLEDDIFHYVVDPSGEFAEYATPRSESHVARIQAQPDSSDNYSHPEVTVDADAGTIAVGDTVVSFDKDTALMTVSEGGTEVMKEAASLSIKSTSTVQTLDKAEGENFYGGGTQNGRFVHTGETINIANESGWVDGQVASPNPFYWSSDGYGVLRNTFAQGSYNFGDGQDVVTATHNDGKYDAYIVVTDPAPQGTDDVSSEGVVAQNLLNGYFEVTGDAALLPEYAFYLGRLNAYNRDGWSDTQEGGGKAWTIKGNGSASSAGTTTYEYGMADGYVVPEGHAAESLNGPDEVLTTSAQNYLGETPYEYSARAVIDEYGKYDMPLGWFLPNDGYGTGYGHNGYEMTGGVNDDGTSSEERLAAVAANVQNLGKFSEYANAHGVETGLWTQSNLTPDSNNGTKWQKLRDFKAEVTTGGVVALKTDVAWVGSGYSFGLNGIKQAYDIVSTTVNKRPNIVTVCGWAGTQRFAGVWTGDQTGGEWEYIRFHIPTYIGQSLSGNPNTGSDMDGIHGGSALIATRDYQWKTFTPLMLDMDGWGTYAKGPYVHGDPYTGISRMYLKLKSQLMPYIYTSAASAANVEGWTGNGDNGLPMIRAMVLADNTEENAAYAASTATQYQYLFGGDFLVAPVYQDTQANATGDDVRNNIYLPGDQNDVWIDYWSGEQYRGGQVVSSYDAPLWKLPLFVKGNAIIPMYEANNNPQKITDDNPNGLDKTQRIVDFYPVDGENSYVSYEDDGISITNETTEDDSYGVIDDISYGDHVETVFTSKVDGDTATLTANASTGSYTGYDSNRSTTFKVSVSAEPTSISAKNGSQDLTVSEAASLEDFETTEPEAGAAIWFYDESPVIETFASAEETEFASMVEDFERTPKLYVKFAETDVVQNAQTLVIEGFENGGQLGGNTLNKSLAAPDDLTAPEDQKTPTSITLTWTAVEGATSYDLMVDGTVFTVGNNTTFLHEDLGYNSSHTYQIRSRNADGYSDWSGSLTTASLEDPWRNTPVPETITWSGEIYGSHNANLAFDHIIQTDDGGFHSNGNSLNQPLTLDYGMVYQFEDFDYYQRDDAGNGTVTQMKIEWSINGTDWTEATATFTANGQMQTVDLKAVNEGQPVVARYIRLTALQSVGNFFSASELAFNIVDGTEGFELGSTVSPGTVGEEDYGNLKNYMGVENHGNTADTFTGQIVRGYGDINGNGAYDAYDYAYTMFNLDGGTQQTGDVSGGIALIPSATSAETGDIITFDLYASDAVNVNGFGSLVHFDTTQFEFVEDSIVQSAYTASMENLSIDKDFGDGSGSVNLAFANRGDKDLYSGTRVIASFQLRAKTDVSDLSKVTSTSWLIGPELNTVEVVDDGTPVEFPEPPQSESLEYAQDAFNITMTNDELTTDDGANVGKLIQQSSYDGLFNGSDSIEFEFKWDIDGNHDAETDELPTYVKLPTTMTFEFRQPSTLDDVEIRNRESGNGCVTSLKAKIYFEGDTTQDFSFDSQQAVYDLEVSEANAGKLVTKVEVTPLTSTGTATGSSPNNRMLSLREINFNYTTSEVTVDSIELGDNQTKLYTGELARVDAKAVTADDVYPYVNVSSSDPSVASVTSVADADGNIVWYVRGNEAGTATIAVASALDGTKTAAYKVTVMEGVDTSALTEAIQAAEKYSASAYTEDSYAGLRDAIDAANALLETEGFTASQVDNAVITIQNAIDALEFRPVDESTLINTSAETDVTVVGQSSQMPASSGEDGEVDNVLDYDDQSYWHSNYTNAVYMPQYLIFDLGAEYDLTDVTFLPRQNGTNGDIFEVEILTAASAEDLQAYADNGYEATADSTVASLGTFSYDNNGRTLTDRTEWQQAAFAPQTTQYVMFKVNHSGGNVQDQYCSASEIRFYGTETGGTTPTVDKSKLQALVNDIDAADLKAEDYTEATWVPFENALTDARRVLETDGATQDEVNARLEALQNAYDGLKKTEIPPVEKPDKSALQELVDQVKDTDLSGKTEETADRFTSALKGAQEVLANDEATEAQIEAAWNELKSAYDGLKPATEEPGGEEPGTGQQPGGGQQGGGSQTTPGGGQQGGGTQTTPGGVTQQGGSQQGGGLAQTSDPTSFVAVLATALAGAGALAISRKRR